MDQERYVDLQQRDVIIRYRDAGKDVTLPATAKKLAPTDRGYVLALGEATGHLHRIAETWADQVEVWEDMDGTLYIKALAPAVPLTHEEHALMLLLPHRIGKRVIVQEESPFDEAARNVTD